MARLNIEDTLESKSEFWRLLDIFQDRDKCLGILIRFFRLAQKRYGQEQPITEEDLSAEGLECMIASGWAVPIEGGYRAKGADRHFDWYRQRVEAGKKRAKSKREPSGKFAKKQPAVDQRNTSEIESRSSEKPAAHQPLSLSLSLSPSLSIPNTTYSGEIAVRSPDDRNPVALWVKAYKEKYGVRYAFQKKDFGILKNFGSQYGPDQCEVLFACYLAIDEAFYANAKHPLSLFFRDLQKISVAAQTGVDPSKPKPTDYSFLEETK